MTEVKTGLDLIAVRVVSPRGEILSVQARSLSSTNSAGKFDVLPEHANFVTFIDNAPIEIVLADGEKKKVQYNMAIMHAFSNKVNIYTGIVTE